MSKTITECNGSSLFPFYLCAISALASTTGGDDGHLTGSVFASFGGLHMILEIVSYTKAWEATCPGHI